MTKPELIQLLTELQDAFGSWNDLTHDEWEAVEERLAAARRRLASMDQDLPDAHFHTGYAYGVAEGVRRMREAAVKAAEDTSSWWCRNRVVLALWKAPVKGTP